MAKKEGPGFAGAFLLSCCGDNDLDNHCSDQCEQCHYNTTHKADCMLNKGHQQTLCRIRVAGLRAYAQALPWLR